MNRINCRDMKYKPFFIMDNDVSAYQKEQPKSKVTEHKNEDQNPAVKKKDQQQKSAHEIMFPKIKTNYIKCSDIEGDIKQKDELQEPNVREVHVKEMSPNNESMITWEQLERLID